MYDSRLVLEQHYREGNVSQGLERTLLALQKCFPDMSMLERYHVMILDYFPPNSWSWHRSWRCHSWYHVDVIHLLLIMYIVVRVSPVRHEETPVLPSYSIMEWLEQVGGYPNCTSWRYIRDAMDCGDRAKVMFHAINYTLDELVNVVATFAKYAERNVGELISCVLDHYHVLQDVRENHIHDNDNVVANYHTNSHKQRRRQRRREWRRQLDLEQDSCHHGVDCHNVPTYEYYDDVPDLDEAILFEMDLDWSAVMQVSSTTNATSPSDDNVNTDGDTQSPQAIARVFETENDNFSIGDTPLLLEWDKEELDETTDDMSLAEGGMSLVSDDEWSFTSTS
jgi:hypothetical protein